MHVGPVGSLCTVHSFLYFNLYPHCIPPAPSVGNNAEDKPSRSNKIKTILLSRLLGLTHHSRRGQQAETVSSPRATGAETTHTRAARAREVHVHCTRCTMYGYRSRARYICVLTATERHCCSLVVIALAVIALAVLGIDVITLLLFSNSCVI